jgi:hypothetical protein
VSRATAHGHFTSSDFVIHLGEVAFSILWLAVFLAIIRTRPTVLRVGVYIGATFFPVLWDWILGQDGAFRLTYDDRLTALFTIDGRAEPIFAPLAYGVVFGGSTVLALHHRGWLERRLGRWVYPMCWLAFVCLDVIAEGFAVSVMKLWVFDYRASWLVWGVPITTALYVGITGVATVYAAFSLARLAGDRESAPGVWWIASSSRQVQPTWRSR